MEKKEDEILISNNTEFHRKFTTDYPPLLTEPELIDLLRLTEITDSSPHNVILNLIRNRDLPRIQISKTILFPLKAVLDWIDKETTKN